MVRVCGTPYVVRNNRSCRSSCPPPSGSTCAPRASCNSRRVVYAGPSYVRSPWYRPVLSRPVYTAPVVVESSPSQVSVIHRDGRNDGQEAAAALIAAAIIVGIAVAVSISRDCHFIETQCSAPDLFGYQVCQDIYDCKW